jgi:predicted metal-dependent peptidase
MQPNHESSKVRFSELLSQVLPKMDKEMLDKVGFIAIDVSSSMRDIINREDIKKLLKSFVLAFDRIPILGVDTSIVERLQLSNGAINKLDSFQYNGGTDIPLALSEQNIRKGILLTDEDGWKQFSSNMRPKITYMIKSGSISVILSKQGKSMIIEKDLSREFGSLDVTSISKIIKGHIATQNTMLY